VGETHVVASYNEPWSLGIADEGVEYQEEEKANNEYRISNTEHRSLWGCVNAGEVLGNGRRMRRRNANIDQGISIKECRSFGGCVNTGEAWVNERRMQRGNA
jgi:hypothetical protein